jgi:DUF971 family protein
MVSTDPAEVAVRREQREVVVRWQDGHESVYPFDYLRQACPCAPCNERREASPANVGLSLTILDGPVVRPGEIQVTAVNPVGRYALNLVWSDGHHTGIYAYAYLREICPCPACRSGHQSSGSSR